MINQEALLKEIFPIPAEKVVADRFTASSDETKCMADCNGECSSIIA